MNVVVLEAAYENGEMVTPVSLVRKGIASKKKGVLPMIKILGTGELSKKLTVAGCIVSASAKEKIEKAGGEVTQKAPKKVS